MASPPHPGPEWTRLGQLLITRRVSLDSRYRNRRVFCEETSTDYRVVGDIESARRPNFSQAMITHLESAYQLQPGNIKRILSGGEIEPIEPVVRATQVPTRAPHASLADAIAHLRRVVKEETARGELSQEELRGYMREIRAAEELLMDTFMRQPTRAEETEQHQQRRAAAG